ncbi:helix-turn-helix transcriptional regulator [Undibacterium sp. TJN19]
MISILNILQARGRATAPELAAECGVTLRTVYRDIDAMSEAGIPVYSERGSAGGYRLLDGYRIQLNGLSAREAEALFMTGLTGAATDLGLGAVMVGAQNKLLSAMPAELRKGAVQMRRRFHLDAPAWFAQADQPVYLPQVADAVWTQQAIYIRYESWNGLKERIVEPLGVVMKSGAWYMVAQGENTPRTYKISRIHALSSLDQHFTRPADFDLAAYWDASTLRLQHDLHENIATIRLSPTGIRMREIFLSAYIFSEMKLSPEPDEDGWYLATIPVGKSWHACIDLLRFGEDVEVLEPPELREKMREMITKMSRIYNA